jgi:hypothetical protein
MSTFDIRWLQTYLGNGHAIGHDITAAVTFPEELKQLANYQMVHVLSSPSMNRNFHLPMQDCYVSVDSSTVNSIEFLRRLLCARRSECLHATGEKAAGVCSKCVGDCLPSGGRNANLIAVLRYRTVSCTGTTPRRNSHQGSHHTQ